MARVWEAKKRQRRGGRGGGFAGMVARLAIGVVARENGEEEKSRTRGCWA